MKSCDTVLNGLVDRGLAVRKETGQGMRIYMSKEVADRISFGQLMGSHDVSHFALSLLNLSLSRYGRRTNSILG